MRLSGTARFFLAIAAELVYVGGRTLIRDQVAGEIARELVVTAWRLASLAFYAWLFFEPLKAAWKAPARRRMPPLLLAAILVDLGVILAAGYAQDVALAARLVYILTIPLVAVREEVFYRFILQDGLERRMPPLLAILLASTLFVLFHAGAQPMNLFSVASMMAAGVLLGCAYQRLRSLRVVVMLHVLMDLAFMLSTPLIGPVGLLLGCAAVITAGVLAWTLDSSKERNGS